ncbi:uncharacterized protein [Dysidea avara]|uniref:uncharacterized protein n=1 Tax=Dysidea avara TaxID=196820 RepID=UPI00331A6E30
MDSRASMMDITNSTEVEKQTTLAVDKEMQTAERRERQSKKKSENQPTSAANFTSTDKSNVTYVSRYDYDQYNYGSYENDSDSYWNAQNYLDDSYYEEEYNHPYTDYSGYNTSSPFPGSGAPVHYDCWSNLSSSSGMGNLSSSSSCSSTTGRHRPIMPE